MHKLIWSLLLASTILLPLSSQQFPRIPADMKKYKNELNQIAMAGVAVRNDWKYKILEGNVSAHRYKDRVIKYDKRGRTIEKVTRIAMENICYQALVITSFPCLTPFRAINLSDRLVNSFARPFTAIVSRHKS